MIIHFQDDGMFFYFINSTFNICNGKYICISLVCTKIWRNMKCNGKVCFCLQGGGNSSDGNWQSQPKSMGNRSLCENCMILQHCVVLTTCTERERKLQKMSAYNFAVECWWHWHDRVWRLNCCGGVGMVHLNWKLSKLNESFVKKYKFADANLHYLVCNGVALHGMFWESMVDLGCGLQPFLLIGAETGSGFFRSRQDTTWVNQSRHLVSRWIVLVPIFQNINLLSKRNQLQDPVLSIQSHWYHRLSFE